MRRFLQISSVFILLLTRPLFAIDFDELDLPPAGAHEGQMLLGAFVTAGMARGDIIDAENDFVDKSTYTFENETTKLLEVAHLPLSFGISFEYMPIDYVGLKARLRRAFVVQRSTFGPDYENWRETLYSDYSFLVGVSLHATNRVRWDFTLTPLAGYSIYSFTATPVAGQILSGYSGKMKREGSGFVYGAELNCTIYFSGGLFLAMGYEWMRSPVEFSEPFDLVNPQTGTRYMDGSSGGQIETHSFILTAGYAFSN
jgi:hypothetical protein